MFARHRDQFFACRWLGDSCICVLCVAHRTRIVFHWPPFVYFCQNAGIVSQQRDGNRLCVAPLLFGSTPNLSLFLSSPRTNIYLYHSISTSVSISNHLCSQNKLRARAHARVSVCAFAYVMNSHWNSNICTLQILLFAHDESEYGRISWVL